MEKNELDFPAKENRSKGWLATWGRTFILDVSKLVIAFALTTVAGLLIGSWLQQRGWDRQNTLTQREKDDRERTQFFQELSGLLGRSQAVLVDGWFRSGELPPARLPPPVELADLTARLADNEKDQKAMANDLVFQYGQFSARAASRFGPQMGKRVSGALKEAINLHRSVETLSRRSRQNLWRKEERPSAEVMAIEVRARADKHFQVVRLLMSDLYMATQVLPGLESTFPFVVRHPDDLPSAFQTEKSVSAQPGPR